MIMLYGVRCMPTAISQQRVADDLEGNRYGMEEFLEYKVL